MAGRGTRIVSAVALAMSLGAGKPVEAQTGHITVDGYQLGYSIEGEGRTKMMVIGSVPYYQRTFPLALRQKMQIAFLDHRGFVTAPADQTEADVTLEKTLGDIELLRQALGWNSAIIFGHSGHGFMAIEYAKRHPEHVSGVVLMNVGPSYGPADSALTERDWAELVAPTRKALWQKDMEQLGAKIEAAPQDRFLLFMLAMAARSWYVPDFDAAPLWQDVPINLPAIDRMWGVDFAEIDITDGLTHFDRPVLLGLGNWDYLVPRLQSWERVRSQFQELTVRVFSNSGHTPMLEEPELFQQVLLDWIAQKFPE